MCETYTPTVEVFQNFEAYIQYLEAIGVDRIGVCKVIPPPKFRYRLSNYYLTKHYVIDKPVIQYATAECGGVYLLQNTRLKSMSVQEFEKIVTTRPDNPRLNAEVEYLEHLFLKNFLHSTPIHGVDCNFSLADNANNPWNFNNIKNTLSRLEDQVPGITSPFTYYGSWMSRVGWHCDEMDLPNIAYLHYGQPRVWWVVPPAYADFFEEFARHLLPKQFKFCSSFLRHKLAFISPYLLKRCNIPFHKVVQYPGEYVITFPRSYHMEINLGYNCYESVSFATPKWIPIGRKARVCICNGGLKINSTVFSKDSFGVPNIDQETFVSLENNKLAENVDHETTPKTFESKDDNDASNASEAIPTVRVKNLTNVLCLQSANSVGWKMIDQGLLDTSVFDKTSMKLCKEFLEQMSTSTLPIYENFRLAKEAQCSATKKSRLKNRTKKFLRCHLCFKQNKMTFKCKDRLLNHLMISHVVRPKGYICCRLQCLSSKSLPRKYFSKRKNLEKHVCKSHISMKFDGKKFAFMENIGLQPNIGIEGKDFIRLDKYQWNENLLA